MNDRPAGNAKSDELAWRSTLDAAGPEASSRVDDNPVERVVPPEVNVSPAEAAQGVANSSSAGERPVLSHADGELRPGDRLGRFVVHAELGRGGMGVVYSAKDTTLGREVALKVLSGDDEVRRKRFIREARSAGAINDPGIATVYEVGEEGGIAFIAMELIEGRSLRDILDARPHEDRALPLSEALRIAREITRALAKAHTRGIVHRDLKPENVMISSDGRVKLLDFGLAKMTTGEAVFNNAIGAATTEEGSILGTPSYMSPEQSKGESVDVRSDVFSFGVMFYEMLTGERPFSGTTFVAILIAIDRDDPVPPSRKCQAVTDAVERVVLRCLRKNPAERPADANALLRELDEVSTQSSPAQRRLPAMAMALAAATFAGIITTLIAVQRQPGPPSKVVSTEPSASVSAPTALTNLPSPASTSAEAIAAYRKGLEQRRSGDPGATASFERALELDPELAAAHVQLALTTRPTPVAREHWNKANHLRASLTERDRALLDAAEPVLRRQPSDWAESILRLNTIAHRWPGDAQTWLIRAERHIAFDDFEAGIRDAQKALELDPDFLAAHKPIGDAQLYLGRLEDARQGAEACLKRNPVNFACGNRLFLASAHEGDCARAEALVRQLIAAGASSPIVYDALADTLASQGLPLPTIREAARQAQEELEAQPAMTPAMKERRALRAAIRLDALGGDFVSAEK